MKKLFVAAIVAFAGFTTVQAQETTTTQEVKQVETTVQDSVVKTPIKLEELPEAIKTALKGDTYKDWTPTAAFSVKDGDKSYYQVDVKKDEETASLKFNADGTPAE